MLLASATDLAILLAHQNRSLTVTEHDSRFGDTYFAISDEHGLIEVALSHEEAEERINSVIANA